MYSDQNREMKPAETGRDFLLSSGRVLSPSISPLSGAATTPASQGSVIQGKTAADQAALLWKTAPREGCASEGLVSHGASLDLSGWTLAAGSGDHW